MSDTKKAVFFICTSEGFEGAVSRLVWSVLEEKGLFAPAGFEFDERSVQQYTDEKGNSFYFVPTDVPLCWRYPKYLPEMNEHFGDFDFAGMVTYHSGENAPPKVLTVHTCGDVNTGVYGLANPLYNRNLMHGIDAERKRLGLDDFTVVTEATHWSGSFEAETPPEELRKYPVPIVDIDVGSSEDVWNNRAAAEALAGGLTKVFDAPADINIHNVLCVGGVHFDPNFAAAVFTEWDGQGFGVSHIIANQWLVSGDYSGERGEAYLESAVDAIHGGIEAIVFHDNLKGPHKDIVRALGAKLNVPIWKHQRIRKPETLEW